MLKDELDLERPILYSAGGAEIGDDWVYGHSWVIDGYNEDDEFYCNWGWYGQHNGPFSLGNFTDLEGDGLNQIESAIFNVVPVNPTGVATPQLASATFTYSPNGNIVNSCGLWCDQLSMEYRSGVNFWERYYCYIVFRLYC
jgi:hypothetical protein